MFKSTQRRMVLGLAAALVATGCHHQDPSTAQQLDRVQAEAKQTAHDMKDYTYAQKDEFVDKMRGELAALNRDLDQLSAKVESSSDQVKAEAKPKLQVLRNQVAGLNEQLEQARNATESSWDSVQRSFRKAYESAKDGFNQARQWVSQKIAP